MDAAMNVRLGAKTKAFNAAMGKASFQLQKFGKSVQNVGMQMTTAFTLPILGAGVASVKLSNDFDASMTKINTLVRGSTEDMSKLKGEILDMAGETATAPVELADGLYFLESAGLKGENALNALNQTAKASASGLGEMEDLATVGAAAQNAYGAETLTAADAIDKFGIMVRKGMFEASELSSVLGPQLGLASNLGISMDEVGAFISTYTQTTGDATSATNGLSAVMMTFAKLESEPTKAQAEALAAIGMTAEEVTTMVGEDGLHATLQHLQTQFGENDVAMASFFSKSQALKGALGVLGEQSDAYTENLDAMAESTGFVDDAFNTTSETGAHKMKQAMVDLKVAGTLLGESLTPIVVQITDKIKTFTAWWGGLNKQTRDNIAKWLTWLAIAGPVLVIVGKFIVGIAKFIRLMKKWQVITKIATAAQWLWNVAMTANPIGIIITLVGLAIAAFAYFATSTSNLAIKVRNGFKSMMNGVIRAINSIIKRINKLSKWVGFTLNTLSEFEMETLKSTEAVDTMGDGIADLTKEVDNLDTTLDDADLDLDLDDDTSDLDLDDDTGGSSYDEDAEAQKRAEEQKVENTKTALQNISKLKQEHLVLDAADKQAAELQALANEEANALAAVKDTEHAEQEKHLIKEKFRKKREVMEAKHAEQRQADIDKEKTEWEKLFDKLSEGWKMVKKVYNSVMGAMNQMLDAQADKQSQILANKHFEENEEHAKWLEREENKLKKIITNEEDLEKAMEALHEDAANKKTDLEEKQDEESKVLAMKQAKRDKANKLMSAVMGTAQAVVNALGAVPPPGNFVLAGIVGMMGAAQIAAIASTPLPKMAKGGLAYGPTIAQVGEYRGAGVNPEVIAPLDKLQSMMGGNNIQVSGRLIGNDIWLSNDFATANRARFT